MANQTLRRDEPTPPQSVFEYVIQWAFEREITDEAPISDIEFYGESCLASGDNDEAMDFMFDVLMIAGLAYRCEE